MDYDKPFLTYPEQVQLLRKHGLIINNEEFAIHALNTISYYDLVNRYKAHFMNDDEYFNSGLSIEHLYMFSLFDHNVQSFILKYSSMIETLFKTRLAYTLSEEFGVDYKYYLDSHHFEKRINKNGPSYDKVMEEIRKSMDIHHAKNPTKYYLENHNHIPAWILFKNISFGNSINLYRLLKPNAKQKVTMALIPNPQLSFMQKANYISTSMNAIREFRNYIAHNLNFTGLRIEGRYKIPFQTLWLLLGPPFIERKNKKITSADKNSLIGLYGTMLAMLTYLDAPYLRSTFIKDFLLIISDEDSSNDLFKEYATITNLPFNIKERLTEYYQKLYNSK
jgi:hypothetical protein